MMQHVVREMRELVGHRQGAERMSVKPRRHGMAPHRHSVGLRRVGLLFTRHRPVHLYRVRMPRMPVELVVGVTAVQRVRRGVVTKLQHHGMAAVTLVSADQHVDVAHAPQGRIRVHGLGAPGAFQHDQVKSGACETLRQIGELTLSQRHARQGAQDARAPISRHTAGTCGRSGEVCRIVGGKPGKEEGVHALFARRAVELGPCRLGRAGARRAVTERVAHARDQRAVPGRNREGQRSGFRIHVLVVSRETMLTEV